MNRNVHLIKLATDLKYRVKKLKLSFRAAKNKDAQDDRDFTCAHVLMAGFFHGASHVLYIYFD